MPTPNPHEIPGRVTSINGHGGLPALRVESAWSVAEIYPHGAHVTGFQKTGEAPLLFLSQESGFRAGQPIRGGVPVIFPWFGPRAGHPAHGFARVTDWDLVQSLVLPDGSIRLHFRLPSNEPWVVDYLITVGPALTLELAVTNTGTAAFSCENCLHTYFQVGDVRQTAVTGLLGARCLDLLLATEGAETEATLRIAGEVDRTYQDTGATVEIHDPVLRRTIQVCKSGSQSTVVWNPWIAKSQRLPDFGDDEYLHMLCVESGNLGDHALTLAPGQRSVLKVELSSVTQG